MWNFNTFTSANEFSRSELAARKVMNILLFDSDSKKNFPAFSLSQDCPYQLLISVFSYVVMETK